MLYDPIIAPDTKLLGLREVIVMRHDTPLMIKFSVAIVRALGYQIVLVQILSIPAQSPTFPTHTNL